MPSLLHGSHSHSSPDLQRSPRFSELLHVGQKRWVYGVGGLCSAAQNPVVPEGNLLGLLLLKGRSEVVFIV